MNVNQFLCGWTHHSYHAEFRSVWGDGPCTWCKKENPNGHRKSGADTGSVTGAVPAWPQQLAGVFAGDFPIGTFAPGTVVGAPRTEPACPSVTVATEVIGWRSWTLEVVRGAFCDTDYFLVGHYGRRWEGPVMVADQVPAPETANGVYARPANWAGPSGLYSITMLQELTGRVYGSVALSGRVIEGENGYRAERAAIRELWLTNTMPGPAFDLGYSLERRYACPVHWDEVPPVASWYRL